MSTSAAKLPRGLREVAKLYAPLAIYKPDPPNLPRRKAKKMIPTLRPTPLSEKSDTLGRY